MMYLVYLHLRFCIEEYAVVALPMFTVCLFDPPAVSSSTLSCGLHAKFTSQLSRHNTALFFPLSS